MLHKPCTNFYAFDVLGGTDCVVLFFSDARMLSEEKKCVDRSSTVIAKEPEGTLTDVIPTSFSFLFSHFFLNSKKLELILINFFYVNQLVRR